MDTAIWTVVLIWAVVLAIDVNSNPLSLAVALSIMVFTRPEAVIWGAMLILVSGLMRITNFGRIRAWQSIKVPLIAYLASLAILFAVRLIVYGYPFPNSYYAKLPSSFNTNLFHGSLYLAGFLVTNWPVLIILCVTISILIVNLPHLLVSFRSSSNGSEDQSRVRLVALAIITLIAFILPVFEGGDYFHGFRFYQSAWPLLVLPLIAFMDYFGPTRSRPAIIGSILLLLMASFFLVKTTWINRDYSESVNIELAIAERGERTGINLNVLFDEPRPSVGVIAAGGIALAYDGRVVDLVGLNNEEMAHLSISRDGPKSHSGFDPEIFFRQQPEIVLPFGGNPDDVIGFWYSKYGWRNSVMKGTLNSERFHEMYQFAMLSSPTTNAQIIAFFERDFLDTLTGRDVEVELLAESGSPENGS